MIPKPLSDEVRKLITEWLDWNDSIKSRDPVAKHFRLAMLAEQYWRDRCEELERVLASVVNATRERL